MLIGLNRPGNQLTEIRVLFDHESFNVMGRVPMIRDSCVPGTIKDTDCMQLIKRGRGEYVRK